MDEQGNQVLVRIIDGFAVHTKGSGPGLVLLHANGGDHRDFDSVVEQFSANWTVHAIDWPGHGESTSAIDRTACSFADSLPRILSQLEAGPFILVGNSVGGFAGVKTAAASPDLVRALILISPGGFTPKWPGAWLACRLIGSRIFGPLAMRWLPKLYLRIPTPHVKAIRERAISASRSPEAAATFESMWRSFNDPEHDARVAAKKVGVPVMLAWGRKDPVLPWRVDGRRARKAFTSPTVTTFSCGHQPYAEMPEEFMGAVTPFLNSLDAIPR